jgi:hypothetical protein
VTCLETQSQVVNSDEKCWERNDDRKSVPSLNPYKSGLWRVTIRAFGRPMPIPAIRPQPSGSSQQTSQQSDKSKTPYQESSIALDRISWIANAMASHNKCILSFATPHFSRAFCFACRRLRWCRKLTLVRLIVLHEDPAFIKYASLFQIPCAFLQTTLNFIDLLNIDLNTHRFRYFRWTPRSAKVTFLYAVAFPMFIGSIAYMTEVRNLLRTGFWWFSEMHQHITHLSRG